MSHDPFTMPPPGTAVPATAAGPAYPSPMPDGPQPIYPGYSPPPLSVSGHARWAKVGAVCAAVASLCLAASNYLFVTTADDDLAGALAVLALVGIAILGGVTGYVTVCLWMIRVRDIVKPQGYPAPESWKIWAGWFIPFYCLVAPVKAMSDLGHKAGKGRLNGFLTLWWAGLLVTTLAGRIAEAEGIDAGTVTSAAVVQAAAAIASLVGLMALIPRISRVAVGTAP